MLEHGGRLHAAAREYGIAVSDWLDLSTGIAPYSLALPHIPAEAWMRLPQADDGLVAAACDYYGAASLLPVPGSQSTIQLLPRLRRGLRVGILSPCSAEHEQAWRREGHVLCALDEARVPGSLGQLDVLVVVNPNNPSGRLLAPDQLLEWHSRLAARGGWLVVDEAFMDATPALSLASYSHLPGLIVLRSFGKFFGLAGARLGFVLAEAKLLGALEEALGPWPVAGPTRVLGRLLLADREAQDAQRRRLQADSERLAQLLTANGLAPAGGCALFQWVLSVEAPRLHECLARQGILLRRFEQPASLRFGLPAEEGGWSRLADSLAQYRKIQA